MVEKSLIFEWLGATHPATQPFLGAGEACSQKNNNKLLPIHL